MLKQLQEHGTSLSGYKALPPPPREATARALLVENKDKGYPPPHVCFFDAQRQSFIPWILKPSTQEQYVY